ncbi:MAG: hypothetical protein FJZ01_10045 [Candidatus Sericytochromatia bacterium]|nr:hypothetical protein [Candidatus Tanganyikabacteria bacterium]
MPFAHFRVGLDYLPPRGWTDFDAVGLAADLDLCAGLGIDLLRLEVPWEFLGPHPERLSPVALGKLLAALDAAHARGLAVMPAILAGRPASLADRSPWTDPFALRVQVRQVRQLAERLGTHPAIALWDVGATPDAGWGAPPADAAWLWAHAVCGELRRKVSQPLLIAFRDGAGPWAEVAEHADFAGMALAADGPPPYARFAEDPLVPGFCAALAARQAGKPVVVTGCEGRGQAPAASYHREALEAAWKSGARALFASFAALRSGGSVRPHADELSAWARERRPVQPVPEHVTLDEARFAADPAGALQASFRAFAV